MMSGKILYIDDDKVLSKATAELLKKRGYEVELCHSGEEALHVEFKKKADLILLDIVMPDVSGIEVLKEIRKIESKNLLPVIMISSNEEGESTVEALREGANDYVTKPVNIEVLEARIKTQQEIKKLSIEFASKKEIAALNAMITTYNHEINNPLTIAFGMMDKMKRDESFNSETFEKMKKSLHRIKDIVQKIRNVTEGNHVSFDEYINDTKMVKLDKN